MKNVINQSSDSNYSISNKDAFNTLNSIDEEISPSLVSPDYTGFNNWSDLLMNHDKIEEENNDTHYDNGTSTVQSSPIKSSIRGRAPIVPSLADKIHAINRSRSRPEIVVIDTDGGSRVSGIISIINRNPN